MNLICVGGPWDREQLHLSDNHSTAVLDIPVRNFKGTITIWHGRYVRRGDAVVSADCGATRHIAAHWE